MISADAFQMLDRVTGRFLQHEIIECPPGLSPCRWGWTWQTDPRRGGAWPGDQVDRWLAQSGQHPDFAAVEFEKVPAPACGCCGKIERGVVGDRYQITINRLAVDGGIYWRCEKHLGRSPCCVEGCGKTWALKPDEDYRMRFICGRHWREAPLWMRRRVTRIRALARRRGWTAQIHRLHDMAWEACYRAVIRRRTVDPDQVVITAEAPPPALVAELARIGL